MLHIDILLIYTVLYKLTFKRDVNMPEQIYTEMFHLHIVCFIFLWSDKSQLREGWHIPYTKNILQESSLQHLNSLFFMKST